MKDFVLVNGKVVSHKGVKEAMVLVRKGRIAAVGRKVKVPKGVQVIDVKGMHILPGLIDAHVHFRTPGMTAKEDWTTGSKAALAGGVTTVLDMPNTNPPTTDAATLKKKREIVKKKALVNYGFFVGATTSNVDKVGKLKNIAGVKLFMGSSTGNLLIKDKQKLEEFFKKVKTVLAVHAESEECIQKNMEKVGSSSKVNIHNLVRSPECAHEAIREVLHLAKKYGTRVHVCHVTTDREVGSLRKFKSKKVTAEVTPHHLFLTEKDYAMYGTLIKVNPPIRGLIDQVALWEGLKKGWIDMVATDHAPHLLEEKERPYTNAPSGVPGVQTMLPLLLNAVNEKKLKLEEVVKLTSYNPAKMFGIKNKGVISVGADADLTVVNMKMPERICHRFLFSKCGWSPYHDWVLKGWPVMTFVNGELMFQWRDRFGKSLGKEVKFI
jgi:dihydroorotase